jgi:hypothetical protein
MRSIKLVIPALLVMGGFLVCTTATYGTPTYAKKEGKDGQMMKCTVCHNKVGAPDAMKKDPNLTDTGKCYKDNDHSLAKCKT